MARPYIEFVQTQNVDWALQADGSIVKRLNVDPVDGEETLIVRYPAGFSRADLGVEDRAEEFIVLEGRVAIGGTAHGYHGYGFVPRGESAGVRETAEGATLLVFRYGRNDPHSVPPHAEMPAEIHDHFEEMFMLQGEMWTPEGLVRPGAYFYRPPGIVHGPHVSQGGFFQIMRAGANYVRTSWSEPKPLPIGQAYAPTMPDDVPESWRRAWRGSEPF